MVEIVDFELAEDTKALIAGNEDVECKTPQLKKKIYDTDNNILLKVIKTIDSPITIISAEEVTDETIDSL